MLVFVIQLFHNYPNEHHPFLVVIYSHHEIPKAHLQHHNKNVLIYLCFYVYISHPQILFPDNDLDYFSAPD